ncbi:uncharacterized protein YALI1_A11622g [Yarrowia lipolytica]|uniref:Uncharacterized protein n=1 Tax=Yarrowia lipolytica TaxID=4952 RepID=A0A1D8N4H7_YARLL|nr:hypothetical protein YALI1_A11622g [Yarrowia lipolytica]
MNNTRQVLTSQADHNWMPSPHTNLEQQSISTMALHGSGARPGNNAVSKMTSRFPMCSHVPRALVFSHPDSSRTGTSVTKLGSFKRINPNTHIRH